MDRLLQYRGLIGLQRIGDLDLAHLLLEHPGSSPNAIAERKRVQALAESITTIYRDFNYEKSPEFIARGAGKSAEVRAMLVRLLDPEKRAKAKDRLGNALANILDSDEAYQLVPQENHSQLDRIKQLLQQP